MTDNEFNILVKKIVEDYTGDGSKLLHALGALTLGHYYGWKVLSFVVSQTTYLKYQKTLKIVFKDKLEDETDYSKRSFAFRCTKRLNNFWNVIRSVEPMPKSEKFLID